MVSGELLTATTEISHKGGVLTATTAIKIKYRAGQQSHNHMLPLLYWEKHLLDSKQPTQNTSELERLGTSSKLCVIYLLL